VRSLTPVRTIGGGVLIDTMTQRLKRSHHRDRTGTDEQSRDREGADSSVPIGRFLTGAALKGTPRGRLEELRERVQAVGDDQAFVECCVRWAAGLAIGEKELAVETKLPAARLRTMTAELTRAEKLLAFGPSTWIHAETARAAGERVLEQVGAFHRQAPESPGMTFEELRTATGFSKEVLEGLVARLKTQARLTQRNQRLALPAHRETLAGADQQLFEAIDALYRGRPFNPPEENEVIVATKAAPENVRRVTKILLEHERLVRTPDELLFHRAAVEQAREILVAELKSAGRLESVRWKYLLNTTRKYAIPLLDYFDRIGVTRRLNNTRYLRT
jgi:selenocysteine-specific elongation factor